MLGTQGRCAQQQPRARCQQQYVEEGECDEDAGEFRPGEAREHQWKREAGAREVQRHQRARPADGEKETPGGFGGGSAGAEKGHDPGERDGLSQVRREPDPQSCCQSREHREAQPTEPDRGGEGDCAVAIFAPLRGELTTFHQRQARSGKHHEDLDHGKDRRVAPVGACPESARDPEGRYDQDGVDRQAPPGHHHEVAGAALGDALAPHHCPGSPRPSTSSNTPR